MKAVVVQYRTKADRADENQEADRGGVPGDRGAQARRLQLPGVPARGRRELRAHGRSSTTSKNPDSLGDLAAFQAFTKDIADRCEVPPAANRRDRRRHLRLTAPART